MNTVVRKFFVVQNFLPVTEPPKIYYTNFKDKISSRITRWLSMFSFCHFYIETMNKSLIIPVLNVLLLCHLKVRQQHINPIETVLTQTIFFKMFSADRFSDYGKLNVSCSLMEEERGSTTSSITAMTQNINIK